MKKRITFILCAIITVIFITACASANQGYAPTSNETMMHRSDSMDYPAAAPAASMPEPASDMMWMDDAEYGWDGDMWDDSGTARLQSGGGVGIAATTEPAVVDFSEKIIYSAFANIETMNFDETIAGVHALIASNNAFIETSSVSGINYESDFYGWNQYRYAFFSIRVPSQQLSAMTLSLDRLGNVVHLSNEATNITSQFFDTQSRLNSLNIQEERLLDMLSKAEDVPDLIMIEERLSDVRYQIEMLTTTLTGWQRQVDYSTLTLNINEVEQFTERLEIHRTYWQQIGDGFMSTIRGIGRFFMNLFMWIIVSAPVLIILAVVAVAALIVIRWKLRAIKMKKAANTGMTPGVNNQHNDKQ